MKQHITWEQLKECNVLKLRQLINDDVFDGFVIGYFEKKDKMQEEYFINKIIEFITIGKMIEILKSKGVNWFEVGYPEIKETREKKVFVNITKDIGFWADNLCDALWEAVKHVLEVEDD